jgi:hypothetical protein
LTCWPTWTRTATADLGLGGCRGYGVASVDCRRRRFALSADLPIAAASRPGREAAFSGSWRAATRRGFTTSGGAATVIRNGVGFYTVLFAGVGKPRGIAHVTAVGSAPVWCQILQYGMSGADERIDVACVRVGWALADSRFTVLFSSSSVPPAGPGAYGFVRSDPAGALLDSYNSAAGPNSIGHVGPRDYSVFLSGLGAPSIAGGLQVTAVNAAAPARCKVATWTVSPNGVSARIRCFDAFGVLTDSGWTLSYQRERAISGALAPPKNFAYLFDTLGAIPPPTNFNSALGFGVNTVMPAGVGLRLVTFPRVGVLPDHVQVTAVGPGPEWCGLLTIWGTFGGDAVVRDVICFDVVGAPSGQRSLVSYTSAF